MFDTRVRDRAPTAQTDANPELVVKPEGYTSLTHPDDCCARPFCLAEARVSADGRVERWMGRHRWRVQPLALEWGVVVETAVAVEVDDDPDRLVVHVRSIDMDAVGDEPGQSIDLELTPSEAEALAASLIRSADDVRRVLEHRAREAKRGAERDARAERVPCGVCGELFPVPVEQRGKRISAEAFSAACSATGCRPSARTAGPGPTRTR